MELTALTIREAHDGLSAKKFSAEELARAFFARIEKFDDALHAYVLLTKETAFEQAKKVDAKLARGEQIGMLEGIPCALKDNFNTRGIRTTNCSRMTQNFVPPYDATVVSKLRSAGSIFLGKTNTDEFTCGGSTEFSCFGPTKNPFDLERVAGGSSGGSAAAVAADECIFAMGTDTGGSIREPASFCHCVGLKVTYGRVSRSGVTSFASSWDTIGHLTKTVEDAAIVLQETAGRDPRDATTPSTEVPDYSKNLFKGVKGLRIGIPEEYFDEGVDEDVRKVVTEAIKEYEKLGAQLKKVSLKTTKYAIAVYYIAAPAELSANLARFDAVRYGSRPKEEGESLIDYFYHARGEGFGPEIKRRIMIGTYVLSAGYYDAYYKKAQQVRTLIIQDFNRVFQEVDLLMAPVSPITAWKVNEKIENPLAMYLADAHTIPVNAAGLPAISIPCGFSSAKLPIGLQIIGPQFSEPLLFQAGAAYEQGHNFRDTKPRIPTPSQK